MTESEHRVARDAALLDMDACVTRARPSGPPTHTLPARRGPVQRRADPGAVPRDSQSNSASVGTPASRASTRGCARRAVGTARRGGVRCAVPSGAPRARRLANPLGFLCRRTSPFIRLSRADVVAANHQVGRPVLAIGPIGPIDHLGDELTRKTRLGRSQRTAPQPGELRPAPRGRAAYERCGTSG